MSPVPLRKFTLAAGIILALAGVGLSDTLITTSGGKYEGKVTEDGDGYVLVKSDGGSMTFPKAMVARVEKSSSPATPTVKPLTPRPTSKPDSRSTGGSTVDVSSLTDARATPAGNEKLIERGVTGIGTDPDKALQAAFSQAIESTVGVLVDAETVVKNDKIIKDQILTFSRGFIQKFDVVRQWQADGLHHATIKALVQTGKLTQKLNAYNIATHAIPGELISRQIRFEVKNEADATKMFKKILDGFDMTKLTNVEVVGKPIITRDGANAKMQVTAKVSPNLAKWAEFRSEFRPLLDKVAVSRVAVGCRARADWWWGFFEIRSHDPEVLEKQLHGEGIVVGLFASMNPNGEQTQWELFRVPEAFQGSIRQASQATYLVRYTLVDEHGKVLVQTGQPIAENPIQDQLALCLGPKGHSGYITACWIGPVWLKSLNQSCRPWYEATSIMLVSQEDMAKVAKVNVALETVPANEKK